MPKAEPIVELQFGPSNGDFKFSSLDDVAAFIEAEQRALSWFNSPPVQGNMNSVANVLNSNFSQIRNTFQQATNNPAYIPQLKAALEQAFRGARIPLSSSKVGTFLNELQSEQPIVAAAALATWMNVGGLNFTQFEHVKGAMLIASFDADISPKVPQSVKKQLEKLHQGYLDASFKVVEDTAEQRKAFALERAAHRKATAVLIRQERKKLSSFKEENGAAVDKAVSRLQETDVLYREHMRIKGPVEYWSNKSESHRSKTSSYRKILLWFSAVAGAALILSLYWIASHAIEIATSDKPPAVYLVLVTLSVVLTTIVFWAARILTRLFLSEHHLAIDAEERAIMAQTYLALTAEGQATESERAIVLGSLFRPTADGIVKDDAAPDLSPASLLSKFGTR